MYNVGDMVQYRKRRTTLTSGNLSEEKIGTGTISEVFKSLDGSFWCYWITGENEMLTDYSIISKL
jgi:hypothetical protein